MCKHLALHLRTEDTFWTRSFQYAVAFVGKLVILLNNFLEADLIRYKIEMYV